jgi:hypothetical protein
MFRVAAADTASERVGSAQQFIVVPNLGRKRLAMSGVVLQAAACESKAGGVGAGPEGSLAVRQFTPPVDIEFGFEIYNAMLDRGTPAAGQPATLITHVRVFLEGREVLSLSPIPVVPTENDTRARIAVGRTLRLSPPLPTGDYQLLVTVTDTRGRKPRRASQWTDFSVIK